MSQMNPYRPQALSREEHLARKAMRAESDRRRSDSVLLAVLLDQIALTSLFASPEAKAQALAQLHNSAERIRREREARS